MVASSNKSPCYTVATLLTVVQRSSVLTPSGGDGGRDGVKIIFHFHLVFWAEERGDKNTADSLFCALFDGIL